MNIKSQIKEFEEREGLSNIEDIINSISSFKPEPWGNQVFSIKTTKAL